jgi:putative ABC transport system permease protein
MSVFSRGVRNTFRNGIRTFSIIVILGLSVGLALSMLLARHAVQAKIDSVQSSIGNIITVTPAGFNGFQGGGEPLTTDQLDKLKSLPHVVGMTETLQDRLETGTSTSLQSAIDVGSLGRRFAGGADANDGGGGGGFAGFGGGAGANGQPRTFTPPIIAIGTNNPTSLANFGGGNVNLTSGKAFDPASNDNVALIGQGLATKNNLAVGQTFQAYNTDITVSGIFTSGTRFSDSVVVMPIASLQRLSGQSNDVTNAIVQADSITNLTTTVNEIKATLGSAADVVSQQDTSEQALAPLKNIKSISLFSLTGAVIAGAVIIFLTMLMIVRERRREIAVLKAIGASNRSVVFQFIYEAVTFTLLGAALGLLAGVVAGNPVTRLLVNNSTSNNTTNVAQAFGRAGGAVRRGTGAAFRAIGAGRQGALNLSNIHAAVGWNIFGYGLLAAVVIAVLGSTIPALLIARVRPAEVLRGE